MGLLLICFTLSCNLEPISYLTFKAYTIALEPIVHFQFNSVEEAEVLNIFRLSIFVKLVEEEKF